MYFHVCDTTVVFPTSIKVLHLITNWNGKLCRTNTWGQVADAIEREDWRPEGGGGNQQGVTRAEFERCLEGPQCEDERWSEIIEYMKMFPLTSLIGCSVNIYAQNISFGFLPNTEQITADSWRIWYFCRTSVLDLTDTHCWAQTESNHNRFFAIFSRSFLLNRNRNRVKNCCFVYLLLDSLTMCCGAPSVHSPFI